MVIDHTPGPWSWIDHKLYGPDGQPIVGSPINPANDHLIGAAPLMLPALKRAAEIIKDQDLGDPDSETGWASDELRDVWVECQEAIALARGESKAEEKSDWRPIEVAPKDGTQIIICTTQKTRLIAWWNGEAWAYDGGKFSDLTLVKWWQPLPPSPRGR